VTIPGPGGELPLRLYRPAGEGPLGKVRKFLMRERLLAAASAS
jgi:hypothetical protein